MDDDELLFDELYQLWAKTSWAETRYWQPTQYSDSTKRFKVYAVSLEDGSQKLIASELRDEDAEFIASLHGALPDLIRCLHDNANRADNAEYDKDERECRIFELELENQELKDVIANLSNNPPWSE